jgi:hypothetical protein
MNDIESTVTCPKCDAAYKLKYSRYSREKTHTCSACGESMPIPEFQQEQQASVATDSIKKPPSSAFATWLVENRYMFCGTVCLLVGLPFMIISLFNIVFYIPLATLALVFGVLAVADRKPIQGLILILIVTVLCTLVGDYLSKQRINAAMQEINNQAKQFEETLKKQFQGAP